MHGKKKFIKIYWIVSRVADTSDPWTNPCIISETFRLYFRRHISRKMTKKFCNFQSESRSFTNKITSAVTRLRAHVTPETNDSGSNVADEIQKVAWFALNSVLQGNTGWLRNWPRISGLKINFEGFFKIYISL